MKFWILLCVLLGCRESSAPPIEVARVDPKEVVAGSSTVMVIIGSHFNARISRSLSSEREFTVNDDFEVRIQETGVDELLERTLHRVVRVDDKHLRVMIPPDMAIGDYNVIVTGPHLSTARLEKAFRVVDQPAMDTASDTPGDRETDSLSEESSDADTQRSSELDSDSSADTGTSQNEDTSTILVNDCKAPYQKVMICTGFEQGIPFTVWEKGGEGELTESVVHTGDAAFRSSVTMQEGHANLVVNFSPMFGGTLYFRAYYYVAGTKFSGTTKIMGFRGGHDELSDIYEYVIDINILDDGILQTYHHNTGSVAQTSWNVVPEETWFCLSGYLDIMDLDGALVLSIDDQYALTAGMLDTLPQSGLMSMDIGITWMRGSAGANEIFVDDVVIDDSPVSCR